MYSEANVGIVNKAGAGLGAGAGALLGTAVAGPVGAVVGGTLGALGGLAAGTITAGEEYGAGDVVTPGYPDPKPASAKEPVVLEVPRNDHAGATAGGHQEHSAGAHHGAGADPENRLP